MINDVRRSYFYAAATSNHSIALPSEDPMRGNRYGRTVEPIIIWYPRRSHKLEAFLSKRLEENGFKRGLGYPCVFYHHPRSLWAMVHGDDYVSAGVKEDLLWLDENLKKASEIKSQHIGPCKSGMAEGKVLNRIDRWSACGWEFEADPRHGELIVELVGLTKGQGLSAPGADNDDNDDEDVLRPLARPDVTLFRGFAARCNYLSQDRPDILLFRKGDVQRVESPCKKDP